MVNAMFELMAERQRAMMEEGIANWRRWWSVRGRTR
jgi:hypothetical protein